MDGKSEDLMQYHWDNGCSKAKTQDGSARLIQRAYRNYKKRPISLAKQAWEAVRNDNTPTEKKFLHMPGREYRCTVNLDICYSIYGGCVTYVPENQLYDYISYSKHKKRQLSDRLAIAINKIRVPVNKSSGNESRHVRHTYTASSQYQNYSFEKRDWVDEYWNSVRKD